MHRFGNLFDYLAHPQGTMKNSSPDKNRIGPDRLATFEEARPQIERLLMADKHQKALDQAGSPTSIRTSF